MEPEILLSGPLGVINIGNGVFVNPSEVLAVVPADSAPIKRTIKSAKSLGQVLDATMGGRTESLVVLKGPFYLTTAYASSEVADFINEQVGTNE